MKTQMKKTIEVDELQPENVVEKVKTSYESVDSFDDLEFENDGLSSGYKDVYYVKLRSKEDLYFELSKKTGNKLLTEERKDRTVIDGNLIKIELDSYKYEQREIKTIKLHLVRKDKEGNELLFILNLSFTQLARTIINCLLSINKPINKLALYLYKNGAGFPNVKVMVDGVGAKWAYEPKVFKEKVEDIKNKRGEILSRDYTELDEWLELELIKKIKTILPNQTEVKNVVKFIDEDKTEETFGDTDEDEDASDYFDIDSNDEK